MPATATYLKTIEGTSLDVPLRGARPDKGEDNVAKKQPRSGAM